ncbi:E3 ubiquitin-protein ligase MARCHF7-like isoform X2 [Pristis pectinata]|uniref:E3 ubiquitin-protein ligase MARCHF7-like isoform X2 n=1 Tax=Pristis pectinata TaxID=685728 RepID=UPI00223E6357|nr:E3 ubiquitin-protein ligase MARCHF7-like isoform X2 [Pristis pectinata]
MDPKTSRIPRRVSVEVHNPSTSSSEAKMLYEGKSNVLDDFYATKESEKQEAEFQPTLYNETETPPGAPSGFLTPSENSDSKRPKLVSPCSSSNNCQIASAIVQIRFGRVSFQDHQYHLTQHQELKLHSAQRQRWKEQNPIVEKVLEEFHHHAHKVQDQERHCLDLYAVPLPA